MTPEEWEPWGDEPWDEERSWRESVDALVTLHAECVDDDGFPEDDPRQLALWGER